MFEELIIYFMGKSGNGDKWMAVVNVFAASRKAGSVWKKAAVMLEEAGVPSVVTELFMMS